jgi:hypothetical protein
MKGKPEITALICLLVIIVGIIAVYDYKISLIIIGTSLIPSLIVWKQGNN